MADREIQNYTKSKQPLDKNQSSNFCQASFKQTYFENMKKKGSDFFIIVVLLSDHNKSSLNSSLLFCSIFLLNKITSKKLNITLLSDVFE